MRVPVTLVVRTPREACLFRYFSSPWCWRYRAEVASRLEAVTFEVADAATVADFWARLLDRDVVTEPGGALVAGDETQVGLRFVTSDTDQVGPRRMHLHLTSTSLEDQERTVETA